MSGKDKFGHAQFPDLDHGIRAGLKDLKNHQKIHPEQTLDQFLNTFAEKNGSSEAKYVANKIGVSPNTQLKHLNMDQVLVHLAKIESKTNLSLQDIIRVRNKFDLKF